MNKMRRKIAISMGIMALGTAAIAGDITAYINGFEATESIKISKDNTRWIFRYKKDFRKDPEKYQKTDFLESVKWKNYNNPGRNYQNGLYGTSVTIPFEFGSSPTKLKVITEVGNYGDSVKRIAFIEYSLDGKTFLPLVKSEYGAGKTKLEKEVDLTGENAKKIWIRLRQEANDKAVKYYGSIVFHGVDVAFAGDVKKTVAGDK